jgi:hypothetical protein
MAHLRRRAITRQAAMLRENDGVFVASVLIALPSLVLTFQMSSKGIEQDILTWLGTEGIQTRAPYAPGGGQLPCPLAGFAPGVFPFSHAGGRRGRECPTD